MNREPANETYVAAELARTPGVMGQPSAVAVARTAAHLCALGRSWKRLSEAVCSVPGRLRERDVKAFDRMTRELLLLLKPWGDQARLDYGDLVVRLVTPHGTTVLR